MLYAEARNQMDSVGIDQRLDFCGVNARRFKERAHLSDKGFKCWPDQSRKLRVILCNYSAQF